MNGHGKGRRDAILRHPCRTLTVAAGWVVRLPWGAMTPLREQVFLKKNPMRWGKLPIAVRMNLRSKRDALVDIRAAIADRARVHVMPPVEIFDVAWQVPGSTGCVHGVANVVRVDGKSQFGVKLAGASVLYADSCALRGLLLHEFSHCFWMLQESLTRPLKPTGGMVDMRFPQTEQLDSEADRDKMVPPENWFAPEDCDIFPYQDSELLQGCADEVYTKWIARGLPCVAPPPGFQAEELAYSEEVAEHIRQLGRARHS